MAVSIARRRVAVRLRRSGLRSAVIGVLAPLALAVLASPASAGRNNYYAYTDADGVLHVTNVPERRRGAWKLWKSLESAQTSRTGRVSAPGERGAVKLGSERYHRYDAHIRGAAQRYQLPESLIRAVIHTESNYNARAVSRAGAAGLMQLMPKTAKALGVDDPFDARQNIYGGARYLRLLANRYEGTMMLVLAAYNAGAGNVDRYGGIPPFSETRAYVSSVLKRYYAYERQSQLGAGELRRGPARHIAP